MGERYTGYDNIIIGPQDAGLRGRAADAVTMGREPGSYWLVATDGRPDLSQRPQEFCIAQSRGGVGMVDSTTYLIPEPNGSIQQSGARYATSHARLVAPLQLYLAGRPDDPVVETLYNTMDNRAIKDAGTDFTIAAHLVYPDQTAALLVSNKLVNERTSPRAQWGNGLDFDLTRLVATRNDALIQTEHRAARSLAAVCFLVRHARLVELLSQPIIGTGFKTTARTVSDIKPNKYL